MMAAHMTGINCQTQIDSVDFTCSDQVQIKLLHCCGTDRRVYLQLYGDIYLELNQIGQIGHKSLCTVMLWGAFVLAIQTN